LFIVVRARETEHRYLFVGEKERERMYGVRERVMCSFRERVNVILKTVVK